jgi:CheY-like chemotaxis protein
MPKVKTILYVEDDLVVLTAHRMRLQRAGYHVIPAQDGLEALKKLSTIVPDLVLLDLMLPKFNGEEVLQFLRTNPKLADVPVIILSTNSVRDIAQEDLLERASKRLIKSQCDSTMLLETIQNVMGDAPAEKTGRPIFEPEEIFSGSLQPVAA